MVTSVCYSCFYLHALLLKGVNRNCDFCFVNDCRMRGKWEEGSRHSPKKKTTKCKLRFQSGIQRKETSKPHWKAFDLIRHKKRLRVPNFRRIVSIVKWTYTSHGSGFVLFVWHIVTQGHEDEWVLIKLIFLSSCPWISTTASLVSFIRVYRIVFDGVQQNSP